MPQIGTATHRDPPGLAPHRLRTPDGCGCVYYVRDFVTAPEAAALVARVFAAGARGRWTTLRNRRLQSWGVVDPPRRRDGFQPSGSDGSGSLDQTHHLLRPSERLPPWLAAVGSRIAALGAFDADSPSHTESLPSALPDCCLINEYRPGQGIMPHTDGDGYMPAVATISLGERCLLDIYPRQPNRKPLFSILLNPRSLLVIRSHAYSDHMHGISEAFDFIVRSPTANSPENGPVCINADELTSNDRYHRDPDGVLVDALTDPGVVSIPRVGTRISLTFRICASSPHPS